MTDPGPQRDGLVDWGVARGVAMTLAGGDSGKRAVRPADLRRAARGSVGAVRDYTGLEPRGRLPKAEVVDRREWVEANLDTLRAMAAGLEEGLGQTVVVPGPLGGPLRGLAGAAAGVELGMVSGYLAQRVLGQYDVSFIGPARPPRLLFVAPNLAEARRRLGARRDPFLRWIALHEATHVVQFSAVPWLRGHIGAMAEELLSAAVIRISARELASLARRALNPDPRRLVEAARKGELLAPFVPPGRLRLLRRLQATMALVEGYSEHVMDAITADGGPEQAELRARLERSRRDRGLIETLLARLLGLEMKMRQYTLGKAFCDEVAERRGVETLNRVWGEPAAMPRPSELERPGRWLARVS